MNRIRYIGCSCIHSGDFDFHVPEGHDCWLLLLTHTSALFQVNGVWEHYPESCAVLYSPNQEIHYRADSSCYENDWLRFDSDESFVTGFPVTAIPFFVSESGYIHNLFQQLNWEHEHPGKDYDRFTSWYFQISFQKLSEAASQAPAFAHYWRLIDLRNAIRRRPDLSWNVSSMAEQLGVSVSYLQSIYKKTFGISCMDDVIRERVHMASDFLRFGHESIADISARCGYQNTEHFYRQFKQITGMTPDSYRRVMIPSSR